MTKVMRPNERLLHPLAGVIRDRLGEGNAGIVGVGPVGRCSILRSE